MWLYLDDFSQIKVTNFTLLWLMESMKMIMDIILKEKEIMLLFLNWFRNLIGSFIGISRKGSNFGKMMFPES